MIDLILGILNSAAKIIADWPKNAKDRATRRYVEWRNGYEAAKKDRAARARIIESSVVRKPDKLQGS